MPLLVLRGLNEIFSLFNAPKILPQALYCTRSSGTAENGPKQKVRQCTTPQNRPNVCALVFTIEC